MVGCWSVVVQEAEVMAKKYRYNRQEKIGAARYFRSLIKRGVISKDKAERRYQFHYMVGGLRRLK